MWSDTRSHIGVLTVRSVQRDDPSLRLAVSSQLDGVEFQPPGMPPASVLIVKRLGDPLPGHLPVRKTSVGHHTNWRREVQTRIYDLYHRAVRPANDGNSQHAEAVIFSDQAEILACLLLDLSNGATGRHWWWRTILKSMPQTFGRSSQIKNAFCRWAEYAPAAFSYLDRWGKAIDIIRTMSRTDTLDVVRAVTHAYDLVHLTRDIDRNIAALSKKRSDSYQGATVYVANKNAEQNPTSASYKNINQDKTMWHRILHHIDHMEKLSREQLLLLGLALSLHKTPNTVYTKGYQQALLTWWHRQDKPSAQDTVTDHIPSQYHETQINRTGSNESGANKHQVTHDNIVNTARHASDRYSKKQNLEPDSSKTGTNVKHTTQGNIFNNTHFELMYDEEETDTNHNHIKHRPAINFSDKKQPLEALHSPEPEDYQYVTAIQNRINSNHEEKSDRKSLPSNPDSINSLQGVPTRLAGILYIINLMTQLNLPNCFEDDRQDTWISSWGLLEVIARALISDADIELINDPMWQALAELDHRQSGSPPDGRFPSMNEYQLPTSWWAFLSEAEGSAFFWSHRQKRLRIWSDMGFILIDRPHHPKTIDKNNLQHIIAPYRYAASTTPILRRSFSDAPLHPLDSPWMAGMDASLLYWLSCVIPFIHHYLHRIFNSNSKNPLDVIRTLLIHSGDLYVTASHVDLVMTLENISLPVRIAGLDRDPGWLPAFGHVIQFHFN